MSKISNPDWNKEQPVRTEIAIVALVFANFLTVTLLISANYNVIINMISWTWSSRWLQWSSADDEMGCKHNLHLNLCLSHSNDCQTRHLAGFFRRNSSASLPWRPPGQCLPHFHPHDQKRFLGHGTGWEVVWMTLFSSSYCAWIFFWKPWWW